MTKQDEGIFPEKEKKPKPAAPATDTEQETEPVRNNPDEINATEGAIRVADQHRLDLKRVRIRGSLEGGRIQQSDVEKYVEENDILPDLR